MLLNGRSRVISFYGPRTRNRQVVAVLRARPSRVNKVRIVNLGMKFASRGRGTRVELDALGVRRLR
ncbi:MAG: hypothetical protein AABM31_04685 [Actinomycetota bacterium]